MVQRDSVIPGWKVVAINNWLISDSEVSIHGLAHDNKGCSENGLIYADSRFQQLSDADVPCFCRTTEGFLNPILVHVRSLDKLAKALQKNKE